MADLVLTTTIPSAKVDAYVARYVALYENTELNDPRDEDSGLKYTDKEWIQEHYNRLLAKDIGRGDIVLQRATETQMTIDDI